MDYELWMKNQENQGNICVIKKKVVYLHGICGPGYITI